MDLALEEPKEGDQILNEDGVRFYVQPAIGDYYGGAELGFNDGFYFNHPGFGNC